MKMLWSKILIVLAVVVIASGAYMLGANTATPQTASAAPVLYSQDTVTAVYDSAGAAVVEIRVTQQNDGFYGGFYQNGQGSGFLIDNQGHILTNNHVVSGASTAQVVFKNGNTVDATVVGTDAADDLAIISVDVAAVSGITPLQFTDSSAVKPGQMAIAMGSPYGLTGSVSVGVISGLNRSIGDGMTGMLQTDAALNPGNSGGPLLDVNGRVIGINTAIEADSGARGIGFAVPANVAVNVLPSLIAGKQIVRPWLGISGTALTASLAGDLDLSVNSGVYIVAVVADSPAEKAGLKAGATGSNDTPGKGGDVITAVDGKSVASVEELSTYIRTKQVGDKVTLAVLRNGQNTDISVTLEAWPDEVSLDAMPLPTPDQGMPWPWSR
jgi:S1-C subfamily serine protease